MLALRLARGADPATLARRLLLASATAGVGFLLLGALAGAAAQPGDGRLAALRLLWCAVPLAFTAQLAVAVARADPAGLPRSGLNAAGLGRARLPVLAALSTAVAGLAGSVLALLVFLQLRGDLSRLPFDGAAVGPLHGGGSLPMAAALTLLAVAPATAAGASALAVRGAGAPMPAPAGLPWGTAMIAGGLALGTLAGEPAAEPGSGWLPLPAPLDTVPFGVVGGWLLIGVGVVLAAPALSYLCGRALAFGQPSALRLLAGRGLADEARRLGRPVGALTVAVAAVLAAERLGALGEFGFFGALGTAVVLVAAVGSVATVAEQLRGERSEALAALERIGTPRRTLRAAAALRGAALAAVFAPLSWCAAELLLLAAGA
ncbi:hypothetical protein SAMN06297387_11876 [Streptomyces zhaozhouensis]|uniref:Uncharacterized protein n=1 Tax=Streptomyces zhaozhouensis TaxID=1300267 RepID=A0A286E153_9ACTN|nr:hypothetical protein [Streptomyces zhaozhouensis]SOD64624.1 hypothetical protein SAMN06297387_11876 [Streptomyces zhaozhouensis]